MKPTHSLAAMFEGGFPRWIRIKLDQGFSLSEAADLLARRTKLTQELFRAPSA